jgi:hypothetical protein
VGNITVIKMKRDFENQTFAMDWNKELNMQWSTKALQVAAAVDPRYKHMEADEVDKEVKVYLDNLECRHRELASPGEIHLMLTALYPPTPPTADVGHLITTLDSVEEKSGFGVCGDNCLVM